MDTPSITQDIKKDVARQVAGSEAKLLKLLDAKGGRKPGEARLNAHNALLAWEWWGNSPRYKLKAQDDAGLHAIFGLLATGQRNLILKEDDTLDEPDGHE